MRAEPNERGLPAGGPGKKEVAIVAVLGWVFVALLAISVVGIVLLFVTSLPDLRRYLAIRRM